LQYKFFVDGEWRHDEHHPYVHGQYGIVNTVLLATDPNYIPFITSDIASGNNMDVDNDTFRRVVTVRNVSAALFVIVDMAAISLLAFDYVVLLNVFIFYFILNVSIC
jgi:hypothetical protein